MPQPITIDEYMRERACIFVDADVWVPGVTDVSTPHPEWIQAEVEWAKDARRADRQLARLPGHRRAQRALPLERARTRCATMADWTHASRYSFRFTTDGTSWTRIAQPSGDDWTIVRAFTLPTQ